jgi:hypothetical protein
VAVNPATNHLFIVNSNVNEIVETTFNGVFVKRILIPSSVCPPACNLSGLTFAPGTDGSPRRLYLTDKGVDGDINPDPSQVNDGELYQIRVVNV